MRGRNVLFLGILFAFFLFVTFFVVILGGIIFQNKIPVLGNAIAIVEIIGPIYDTEKPLELLKEYTENNNILGIILRIDSPGGTVGDAQEIYFAAKKARKAGKVVVASLGNVAASGGYYIACAAQEIVSNPGTLTGSIGVIFDISNWQELMKKIGIQFEAIKSGKFKDIGSPNRPMTPEERKLLQNIVNDVYNQFYNVVKENRSERIKIALAVNREEIAKFLNQSDAVQGGAAPISVKDLDVEKFLKLVTDGRVFTGKQAYYAGFVDSLGTLDDTIEITKKLCHIVGKPRIVKYKEKTSLRDLLKGKAENIFNILKRDGFSLEYRFVP